MERHLQTAIQVLLVALVLWTAKAVFDTRDGIVELRAQMVEVRQQMAEMNQRFDRYLQRTEADARFDAINGKIGDNARRLEKLENAQ